VVQAPQQPATFGYGVEEAEQLSAVDELSRRYHAVAALTGFLASLSRHKRGTPSRSLSIQVAKPNQCARQEERRDSRHYRRPSSRRASMFAALTVSLAEGAR